MTQLSTIQVQSWRANCDIQLLLYDSDPTKPNINEIVKVADYIVSYITKGNIGYMTEQKMMQCIIERYVLYFIDGAIIDKSPCQYNNNFECLNIYANSNCSIFFNFYASLVQL